MALGCPSWSPLLDGDLQSNLWPTSSLPRKKEIDIKEDLIREVQLKIPIDSSLNLDFHFPLQQNGPDHTR